MFGLRIQIGNKELNCGAGHLLADGLDGAGPVLGSAVRQVVPCDGGNDDIPQLHEPHALRNLLRFGGVGRCRMSGPGGAETAAPRADVAQNHEGSRTTAPALGLVGAESAAANRMQSMFPDDALHFGVLGRAVKANLQPIGFFSTSTLLSYNFGI